jgi:hypothetical protein
MEIKPGFAAACRMTIGAAQMTTTVPAYSGSIV